MSTKFKNLRNDLNQYDSDFEQYGQSQDPRMQDDEKSNLPKYIMLLAFIAVFFYYASSNFSFRDTVTAPVENLISSIDEPSDELLQGMGEWMEDMGYGELSREELIELRRSGVTATNTSGLRDLGFTDLTLDDLEELGRANVSDEFAAGIISAGYSDVTKDQLIMLRRADVSATFTNMMKSLGYELTVDELAELRRADVTAYFTSNIHDLGYQDVTKEELIRMKNVGVSRSLVERLVNESETKPTIDDIIRYRISNQ